MNRLELRLIGSFVLWYWLFLIVAVIVVMALSIMLDEQLSLGNARPVIAAMPATYPGKLYFKRMNDFPPSGFAWRMAFYFFLFQLAFELVPIFLFLGFNETIDLVSSLLASWARFAYVLFIATVQFLLTRFAFSQGAKYEEKRQAEKLQKAR